MASPRETAVGEYIRHHVLPEGMTVTAAAETLGVTRVALSNLLNGRASLSRQMALRLKAAFGADTDELLRLQEDSLAKRRREEEQKIAVRSYVPPFLKITSAQIHEWADKGEEARSRLPVLLRRLVRSTGHELRRVDFPGHGDAQRPGWDGWVDAGGATHWIPEGGSGWELSTAKDPRPKANRDFEGPRADLPEEVRSETTFVFVSSREWRKKRDWEEARRAEGRWKDVRALDASDLAQWLEESIEGQVWLAEELGLPSLRDCMTLDRAWREWSEASDPPMTSDLLAPAVAEHRGRISSWLRSDPPDRPLYVAADSKEEALAFLACMFRDEGVPADFTDRAVVVNSAQTVRTLAPSKSRFIPIVAGKEAERELASLYRHRHCIIVCPRNTVDQDPDVLLGLARHETFRDGLMAMGLEREKIDRLVRVSGRSPTVLRRRLSRLGAIREPWWAEKAEVARKLAPLTLVGVWHAESRADQEVLQALAERPFDRIEEDVAALLGSDDCPVWSVGQHRGVVSKFDGLFAIGRYMTSADLSRFLTIAQNVLAETDPALELPRKQRWMANLYGKVRTHSKALRTGVGETLVLLSVHGNDVFHRRLGIDVEADVGALVRQLLRPDGDEVPLTTETLESYEEDLPILAEAAPEEFLRLVESDLANKDAAVRELLRPVETDTFAGCPRAGLLWGLECLAWDPSNLSRVVLILAELAKTRIDDNYVHKPIHSLEAVFQSGAPQTAAPLGRRVEALKLLRRRVPDVAWGVCMKEIRENTRDESYRPRWRGDASGAGRGVPREEAEEFVRSALGLSLNWPGGHDASKLGDLIDRLAFMSAADQDEIWSLVEDWMADQRSDSEKAELRERLRRFGYATGRPSGRVTAVTRHRAKAVYDLLAPDDPAGRHAWMFAKSWVHDWPKETADGPLVAGHLDRVRERRDQAMKEIWSVDGLSGVLGLLTSSGVPEIVGLHAARCVPELSDRVEIVQSCLSEKLPAELELGEVELERFVRAFVEAADGGTCETVVSCVAAGLTPDQTHRLLLWAPFVQRTWRIVAEQEAGVRRRYWRKTRVPLIGLFSEAECVDLVDGLLGAARPFAAFNLVSMDWDAVETSRLIRLLRAMIAAREADAPLEQGMFSFHISKALESLDGRTGVSRDVLADLEFGFSEILEREERGMPNVGRRVAESPGYFVWLVACAYLRRDGRDDPKGWPPADSEAGRRLSRRAHSVLKSTARIPGCGTAGLVDGEKLRGWIAEARRLGVQFGRIELVEMCIGELLARKPPETERAWPEPPICEALETVGTDRLASGFSTGAINAHRVRRRGSVSGETDSQLASKYRTWAEARSAEYPFVARALRSVAAFYDSTAAYWDSDDELQRRLRN